jgi:hypothetical protein
MKPLPLIKTVVLWAEVRLPVGVIPVIITELISNNSMSTVSDDPVILNVILLPLSLTADT